MTLKKMRILYPAIVRETDSFSRVRAEITEMADGQLKELPWCLPLLDSGVFPKIGEGVWVIIPDPEKPYGERLWVSRRVSSFEGNSFQEYDSAFSGTNHSRIRQTPESPLKPQTDDIWLYGRGGSDIRFGESNLELGVDRTEKGNKKISRKNARIRLTLLKKFGYTAALYADNIVLASYNQSPKPNEQMQDIDLLIESLYSSVRGENLAEILKRIVDSIRLHTHKYHQLPADPENFAIQRLNEANIEGILNKNIKIN